MPDKRSGYSHFVCLFLLKCGVVQMEIGTLFAALGHAKVIAELLGVLDSIDSKVDRLVKSEFNAALRFLKQAKTAEKEHDFLLRNAGICFTKAIDLEYGFRQAKAYLGLAVTQHLLGEAVNCRQTLVSALTLNPFQDHAVVGAAAIDLIVEKPDNEDGNYSDLGKRLLFYFVPLVGPARLFTGVVKNTYKRISQARENGESLSDYWRKVRVKSLSLSSESRSIALIQNQIAKHIGEPIPWPGICDTASEPSEPTNSTESTVTEPNDSKSYQGELNPPPLRPIQ